MGKKALGSKYGLLIYLKGDRCWYCGCLAIPLQVDHVLPRRYGGSHDLENLVPCCVWCNQHKGVKHVETFRIVLWLKKRHKVSITCPLVDHLIEAGVSFHKVEGFKFYGETLEYKEIFADLDMNLATNKTALPERKSS